MVANGQGSKGGFVVTRQPVFDRRLQPWGSAVDFRPALEEDSLFSDELTASFLLEANMPHRAQSGEQTIISLSAKAILCIPYTLSPQGVYLEVEEAAGSDPDVSEAVRKLKQAGFGIAVGGFSARSSCRDLCGLADVLVLDADGQNPDSDETALAGRIQGARQFRAKVQVRGLTSWHALVQARTANADMFQGFFFNRMNLTPKGKSVTATQLSRLRLLECLDKDDVDYKTLAQLVEADAALTYRLLVFLNSAHFGFGLKVHSIEQAILLAGWKSLKNWLKIVLLTNFSPSPRHQELCYYSAQRSDFLQRVAKSAGLEGIVPALSLLGLLSYMEPILEMPMDQVLANVPVADDIRLALCGKKSRLSAWLALVQAMEWADWDRAERLGKSAGLTMADLGRCYRESFAQADTLFRVLGAPQLQDS